MEFAEFADSLLVEVAWRWSFVEVEVAAEDFICTLTAEHHLYAHGLDDSSEEVHRCGGTDSGDIVGLYVVYYIADGVETFLYGIVDFMVDSADMVSHFLGFGQVGGSLEAYGEAVELWPPCCRCIVCLHTHGGIFLCDS